MSDTTNLSSVQAIDLVRIDSNVWGGETSLNPKLLSPDEWLHGYSLTTHTVEETL